MTLRSPLASGALGFILGILCTIAVIGCCASPRLPTPQENKDYCEGQLLLCIDTMCPTPAGGPDPCRKACQDDYDNCMRCPTRKTGETSPP